MTAALRYCPLLSGSSCGQRRGAGFLKSLPALDGSGNRSEGKGILFSRGEAFTREFLSAAWAADARAAWEDALKDSRRGKPGCVLTCGFAGALTPLFR